MKKDSKELLFERMKYLNPDFKLNESLGDNIMTFSEFQENFDSEVSELWFKTNKQWLLTNSSDNPKWEERSYAVKQYEHGGDGGRGNLEAMWNDEDQELGYEAMANLLAKTKNISIVPDVEGMEYDGENFGMSI